MVSMSEADGVCPRPEMQSPVGAAFSRDSKEVNGEKVREEKIRDIKHELPLMKSDVNVLGSEIPIICSSSSF